MPLSKEQLTIERYKVIGNEKNHYPGSPFSIGDILEVSGDCAGKWRTGSGVFQCSVYMPQWYPHLFQKLEWHDDRKPEEMPEYVKSNDNNSFDEIEGNEPMPVYKIGIDCEHGWNEGGYFGVRFKIGGGILCDYLQPSDKEEYQQYLLTQNLNNK